MIKRILYGGILLLISIGMLVYSINTGLIYVTICGVLSTYEMDNALSSAGKNPIVWPGYVLIMFAVVGIFTGLRTEIFIYFLPLLPLLVLAHAVFSNKVKPSDALLGMGVCLYPILPIVFIMFMLSSGSPYAPVAFVTAMVASIFSDSFAFFTGKTFGRSKLAPRISPNKTIEGLIGGLIFGTASGFFVYFVMEALGFAVFTLFITVGVAFAATASGMIGDLAASAVKREAGIKDFSNLIPGHGGIMDRIDSLIFAIPTVYMLAAVIGLM